MSMLCALVRTIRRSPKWPTSSAVLFLGCHLYMSSTSSTVTLIDAWIDASIDARSSSLIGVFGSRRGANATTGA